MEKENMFLNQMQQNTINELNCSNFWDNLVDRRADLFESALSSTVSSPTASNNVGNGENIVLRELIGRLGGVSNNNSSGEVSTHPYNVNVSNSVSCYSTPLSSPPKLNLSTMMMENHHLLHHHHQIRGNMNLQSQRYATSLPRLSPFATDPGLAERAARFSCFAKNNIGVSISSNHQQSLKKFNSENGNEFDDSRENSTVSEQIPNGEIGKKSHNYAKKRKADAGVKGKENSTVSTQVPSENSETSAKRIKPEDLSSIGNEKDNAKKSYKSDANDKKSKDDSKTTDPPKDYIHVRARRGQATDAHSLAERFRREKISERMKFLQDLVPGCNKVTGKAVMLDEIINYVQSLQRQVEFLSMKLATVNPRADLNIEGALASKMSQSRGGSFQHNPYASEYHQFQAQANLYSNAINNGTGFNADSGTNQTTHLDNFSSEMASQVSTFWEDDLRSVVQMGIAQNQT